MRGKNQCVGLIKKVKLGNEMYADENSHMAMMLVCAFIFNGCGEVCDNEKCVPD